MATVTKDTIIMDVLRIDEGTAPFFFEIGMPWVARQRAASPSQRLAQFTV